MNRKLQLQALVAVLFAGMMFSSCGNVDIVKRKYRPGFHVDVTKKQKRTVPVDQVEVADAREVEKGETIEAKKVKQVNSDFDNTLTASATATPDAKALKSKPAKAKKDKAFQGFAGLDFKRWTRDVKNGIRPDKSPAVANVEWMKWVSFGTGIGSLAFGAFALIFALVLAAGFWTPAVWPLIALALLLGAAAITFAVIFKKNGGSDSKAKLGMLFGIIGAGLAVLAIIFWAVFWTIFWL